MTDRLSVSSTEARVPHISLVFREMWDTTALDAQLRWLSLERRSYRSALPQSNETHLGPATTPVEPLPFPCHPDRSEAERRDLRFRGPFMGMLFGPSREICDCPGNDRSFTQTKAEEIQ
jgi:hypothetical protein